MSTTVKLPLRAKGARPYFFDDPAIDKCVAMIMGLAGEVSVLHDRLDTMERLIEARGGVKRADIEAFEVTAEVQKDREAWRDAFLENVLRILHQELEDPDAGQRNEASYQQAIESVTA